MRTRRLKLPAHERIALAKRIAAHVHRSHLLRPGKKIAAYLAVRGEVDLQPVIEAALRMKCHIYVPRVLSMHRCTMQFVRLYSLDDVASGAFNIHEPRAANREVVSAIELDTVLMPVVSFDIRGTRLGMGAGFYDRAFSRLARFTAWRRPRLIGIAYDFQRVDALRRHPWDVPLDAAITDRHIYRFDTPEP